MGRAMIIITMGLLVALGYTFFGMKTTGQSMNQRNLKTYNAIKAKNTAHTGIQIAIEEYNNRTSDNDSSNDEFSNLTVTNEGATLSLTVDEDDTNPILRVTSVSNFQESKHEVISTFDISEKQNLVPDFVGALSSVGGNTNIEFQQGNPKIHFQGNAPSGSGCSDKPGFTLQDANVINNYDELSIIDGDPPVAFDDAIAYDDIIELIDALTPLATTIRDDDDFTSKPQVYVIDGYTHFSGKTTGSGVLIVRNNPVIEINGELAVTGQFEFNGLVIFENGSNFKGTGKAQFNGSIIAASDDNSTFNIKANGNFETQYDCRKKEDAEEAVGNLLYTTIYKQLSIYE